uniref:UDP-glucuronic acid decarboxylase 1 n=1 Tax=Bos taurus TaxID=9913 RepID=A0AAA9T394_BOVIN
MLSQPLLRLVSAVSRRRMKLLLGIALLAYVASVWGNLINMRSIQENRELRIESRIEEIIEPLREKIRDLEKSFTQKYPPVKFLSEKDRKRILVTGGAGFVGSHLTDKLMMDGHEVTVVDNFFTGRKRNVEHWIGHENFELINHDVVEPLYIEVDQIYHLASPASPPNYMYNPIKTLKTNTIGTLNMLGLAKRVGARLLLASTSEVYGDPEVHPQTEDYWGHVNPIGPRACYDEGKRVAETMCYAYMKQEGVEVRVARIFNTFGPRMHMNDGRVVSNFILQALQGEPLTVYGSGSQTRAFQYVSDLVNGLVALMNSNVSSPVNLGNPEEHTILEFAQLIKNLVAVRELLASTGCALCHRCPGAPRILSQECLLPTVDQEIRVSDTTRLEWVWLNCVSKMWACPDPHFSQLQCLGWSVLAPSCLLPAWTVGQDRG